MACLSLLCPAQAQGFGAASDRDGQVTTHGPCPPGHSQSKHLSLLPPALHLAPNLLGVQRPFPLNILLKHSLITKVKYFHLKSRLMLGFPGGASCKESPTNAGDVGSVHGTGRDPGGGHGSPLQYPCLENPMDRGAWPATISEVAQSQT